ncbi:HAD family hydrolase [Gaiella occulta]|uniref:HAD family hydrolase n=1 Tax=Gaiella occulta TaxID=1002870 RepID=UPI0011C054D0|nr:HAD family hydrolase [Gaiella occulta]
MTVVTSFDVGGTLIRASTSCAEAICTRFQIREESRRAAIRTLLRSSPLDQRALRDLADLSGVAALAVQRCLDEYLPAFEWQDGAHEALGRARSRGRVVTLSNVSQIDDSTTGWIGFLIDASYSSWRTGYVKPDRRAYENLIDTEAVPASDIIHIGDDWEADVAAPLAVGIRAVYIGIVPPRADLGGVETVDSVLHALDVIESTT